MPRLPRDISQRLAIRAMVKLGGQEIPSRGKSSHRTVVMPNGFKAVFPSGTLKTGLLADQLKSSEVSIQDFIDAL